MKRLAAIGVAVMCASCSALAAPLEKMPDGHYAAVFADLGEWQVRRYYDDAKGTKPVYCAAHVGFDGEMSLYIRDTAKDLLVGFQAGMSGPPLQAETPVKVTVDGKAAGAITLPFKPGATEEGIVYNLHLQKADAVPGLETLLAKASEVEFSYSAEGAEQLAYYPLAGSGKALKSLADCARQ